MIKLLPLVSPTLLLVESEEKQLPEEFTVSERGLDLLKQRIDALNKKAAKYKVPPIEIEVVKEEMVKELHPSIKKIQKSNPVEMPLDKGVIDDPKSWVFIKKYVLRLKGEPPRVDGYEFIARLEHTSEGNFIFTNPKSSVPNIPSEFKTMNQRCDVCHTNRDRNDTFILKLENDDPARFPNKKKGDFLIVGRNCLARFLPGISVAGLIAWTKLVENIHDDIQAAEEVDNDNEGSDGKGSRGSYYEHTDEILKWIVAAYLYTGSYLSRKQANANAENGMNGSATQSTLDRALNEMRPNLMYSKNPKQEYPIYFRLKDDADFKSKVEAMVHEFEEWLPKQDWDAKAEAKPDFANFFHNLKLVSNMEYLKGSQFGFFSGLVQLFLRDKKEFEKKADAEKQKAMLPQSPVKFDDPTLIGKRLRDVAKESEIKRLASGGMDEKSIKKEIRGKEFGWNVTVKKISEYEKTQTFGYGDSGIGYRILFVDDFGNEFMWFAGTTLGMEEGGKYAIDGSIASFEPPNQYHPTKEQIRINRVKVVKDLKDS